MPRVGRRIGVVVAVMLALVACSDDEPPVARVGASTTTSADAGPVTAVVERSRVFADARMLELVFVNTGPSARRLTAYRLESTLFEPTDLHARDVRLRADGQRIAVPMPYGSPSCDADVSESDAAVVAVLDGSEERIPVDPAPLRQQHAQECAEVLVREAAVLRFGESWSATSDRTIAGEVLLEQRLDGASVEVQELAGTVVFAVRADGDLAGRLRVDDDEPTARVGVTVEVTGCAAHALIESKKTYRFPVWVSVDGAEAVRVELQPEGEARREMERLLAACSG